MSRSHRHTAWRPALVSRASRGPETPAQAGCRNPSSRFSPVAETTSPLGTSALVPPSAGYARARYAETPDSRAVSGPHPVAMSSAPDRSRLPSALDRSRPRPRWHTPADGHRCSGRRFSENCPVGSRSKMSGAEVCDERRCKPRQLAIRFEVAEGARGTFAGVLRALFSPSLVRFSRAVSWKTGADGNQLEEG